MKSRRDIKLLMRQNLFCYLIAAALLLGIKYYYSRADCSSLSWILAPTAWWVSALSGISFEMVPQAGYVSHSYRFIIAASCSGVQFMVISMATLIFSYIHRQRTIKGKLCWIALSAGASYLLTVTVNGFRIILAIFIPIYLDMQNRGMGRLSPERLHTVIGTAVYFFSLFVIYRLGGYVSRLFPGRKAGSQDQDRLNQDKISLVRTMGNWAAPAFWYFFIILGIPLLNSARKNDIGTFADYALLLAVVCLSVSLIYCICSVIHKHIGRRRRNKDMQKHVKI